MDKVRDLKMMLDYAQARLNICEGSKIGQPKTYERYLDMRNKLKILYNSAIEAEILRIL